MSIAINLFCTFRRCKLHKGKGTTKPYVKYNSIKYSVYISGWTPYLNKFRYREKFGHIMELDSVSLYFIYGFAVYSYREYVTFLKYQIGPYVCYCEHRRIMDYD